MLPPDARAVVFDAVGTLIHPDPPAAAVYAAVGRRFGSRLDVDAIARRFRAAFADEEAADRQAGLRTSEAREEARWRHIVGRVLDDVRNLEACFGELFAHFSRPDAWACTSGAGWVLAALASRGLTLAMASNYDARLRSVAAGLPELLPLRHLVISSEVGWRKPAPEFFAELARATGQPPARTVYVGDDPANDYEGARAAGFHAVLYDPAGRTLTGMRAIHGLDDLIAGAGR